MDLSVIRLNFIISKCARGKGQNRALTRYLHSHKNKIIIIEKIKKSRGRCRAQNFSSRSLRSEDLTGKRPLQVEMI